MRKWIVGMMAVLASTAGASGQFYSHDPGKVEEFRPRDGLPNFFSKIADAEEPVRIAYLGGSITKANGWRVKTMAWFREQYPQASFVEIDAAISGTGSDFAACRLSEDVLRHKPDLVFLECRVNGGGGVEKQSVEGFVRQVWRDNPQTDICFVYTIQINMLESIQAGNNVRFGEIMETIANRYGIPSIDLGVEIAKREQAGTLTFKGSTPEAGKILFAKDGVHPGDAGHQIYAETIARCMEGIQSQVNDLKHTLGTPMATDNWETASLMPITEARLSEGWTPVDEKNDAVYNSDLPRTGPMLRKAVKCNRVGETITVKWTGTTIALTDIPQGDGTLIEAVVDGKQVYTSKRKQTSASHRFARYWRLPTQPPGEHEVVFTIKHLPDGTSFYAGQFMIAGNPLEGDFCTP